VNVNTIAAAAMIMAFLFIRTDLYPGFRSF
jgi:hypothetical protein